MLRRASGTLNKATIQDSAVASTPRNMRLSPSCRIASAVSLSEYPACPSTVSGTSSSLRFIREAAERTAWPSTSSGCNRVMRSLIASHPPTSRTKAA